MSEEAYRTAPASIKVREFPAGGKIMVTTLVCPQSAHKDELKALYKQRWAVEWDIRQIKDTMGMSILTCKTGDMAFKEIWLCLLDYNLVRLLMAQSAFAADIMPRTLSFKHRLRLSPFSSQQADTADEEQLFALYVLMAQQRVGNRPGRIEPRTIKRRPKAYPLLTVPRHLAREKHAQTGASEEA